MIYLLIPFCIFQIFKLKLYHLPTSHAIKIFHILCNHIEKYYQKPLLLEGSTSIRKIIFQWILKLRANSTYHVGYLDENNVLRYSHYLNIDSIQTTGSTSLPSTAVQQTKSQQTTNQPNILSGQQTNQDLTHTTHSIENQSTIPIRRIFKIITDCLRTETDWSVIQLVLLELPNVLQNKALLRGIDIDTFAVATVNLVRKINVN